VTSYSVSSPSKKNWKEEEAWACLIESEKDTVPTIGLEKGLPSNLCGRGGVKGGGKKDNRLVLSLAGKKDTLRTPAGESKRARHLLPVLKGLKNREKEGGEKGSDSYISMRKRKLDPKLKRGRKAPF